jgi:hypothetical protein
MRHILIAAGVSMLALTACGRSDEAELAAAMDDINVIDESGLNDVMMTVADPRRRSPTSTAPPATTPNASTSSAGLAESLIPPAGGPERAPDQGTEGPSPRHQRRQVELAGAPYPHQPVGQAPRPARRHPPTTKPSTATATSHGADASED